MPTRLAEPRMCRGIIYYVPCAGNISGRYLHMKTADHYVQVVESYAHSSFGILRFVVKLPTEVVLRS